MHSISSSSTVIHVPDVSYFFSSQSKRHIGDVLLSMVRRLNLYTLKLLGFVLDNKLNFGDMLS